MKLTTYLSLLFSLSVLTAPPAYAQNRAACELLSKADAEAILGVTLLPPKASAPFRSLLDPDLTSGTPEQGCEFTNFIFNDAAPNRPKPSKVVNVRLEVRYSSAPDLHAVDEARKQVDTRTYDHPTDLPGLGDAAFWIGAPNNVTLFVFLGGRTRLMIGPSEIGLEQEKTLASKALAALGKTTFTYGDQPPGLTKPVLAKLNPNSSAPEQLKYALTARANAGDAKSQLALGRLYESGILGQDGQVQRDYAGAAYWYRQASDRGDAQGAFELANLYQKGLGVAADASQSFRLLQKAAQANYVPAMPLLSDAYAAQKTSVSFERATYWATKAADAGDPSGSLILGFEFNAGELGGDRPYWYKSAMEAFRKAADRGNCVAMMAIGELYSKGHGVPADKTLAEGWDAKAQSCENGNLALLRQQISQYRERAAAAREPALYPMLAAIPVLAKSAAPVARNGHRSDSSGTADVLASIAIAVTVVAAISTLIPHGGVTPQDQDLADQNMREAKMFAIDFPCIDSGGTMTVAGCQH